MRRTFTNCMLEMRMLDMALGKLQRKHHVPGSVMDGTAQSFRTPSVFLQPLRNPAGKVPTHSISPSLHLAVHHASIYCTCYPPEGWLHLTRMKTRQPYVPLEICPKPHSSQGRAGLELLPRQGSFKVPECFRCATIRNYLPAIPFRWLLLVMGSSGFSACRTLSNKVDLTRMLLRLLYTEQASTVMDFGRWWWYHD